jgi:hypothetical protein
MPAPVQWKPPPVLTVNVFHVMNQMEAFANAEPYSRGRVPGHTLVQWLMQAGRNCDYFSRTHIHIYAHTRAHTRAHTHAHVLVGVSPQEAEKHVT